MSYNNASRSAQQGGEDPVSKACDHLRDQKVFVCAFLSLVLLFVVFNLLLLFYLQFRRLRALLEEVSPRTRLSSASSSLSHSSDSGEKTRPGLDFLLCKNPTKESGSISGSLPQESVMLQDFRMEMRALSDYEEVFQPVPYPIPMG